MITLRAELVKLKVIFNVGGTEYVSTGEDLIVEVTGANLESCLGKLHDALPDWVVLGYSYI